MKIILKNTIITFCFIIFTLTIITYEFKAYNQDNSNDKLNTTSNIEKLININSHQSTEKLERRKIPRIIHKVYINHDGTLNLQSQPDYIQEAHATWKTLNPDYEIKYYSRNDCEDYLRAHFPEEYLKTFRSLKPYSYKCDFFRYCVVYREGGVYTDWKMVCLKPLNEYIDDTSTFVGAWDYSLPDLLNGFYASSSKNELLKFAIDICIENTKSKNYNLKDWLYPTGPGCFGAALSLYMKRYNVDTKTIFYKDFNFSKNNENIKIGIHNNNHIWILGERVMMIKCGKCNKSQNWNEGNNYAEMWINRDVYL